ncbi:MAG: right-handed parallel beta-helix repeat-containing protein [Chlamydiales bacterium]
MINQSGEYCLREDVVYNGHDSAITIKVSDVKLKLNTFSITLTQADATGIRATGVSEIVIESDAIKNTNPTNQTGLGIHLLDTNKVLIQNILTRNHFNGLLIAFSTDVQVLDSQFLNPQNAGAFVAASKNVTFDRCVFAGSGNNGLFFTGPNRDCSLLNCEFPDAEFSNLLVQQINGMIVENCSFTNNGGDSGKPNLVQFGDVFVSDQVANDVIFQNCTIVNRPPPGGNTAPEGLGLYNVSGFLVDSCIIDIDNTGQPQEKDLSNIHIGNGSGIQVGTNVTIRNTIVQGPATDGFYPDIGSTFIVIEDCLASGALKDGIFLAGTTSSTVQNCTVTNNGTNGIFLGEISPSNAIINNVITNNGFNPITPITDPSLPPTGNGLGIASDSSFNLIQGNKIFNNAINIQDEGFHNVFIDNTIF